MTQDDAIEIGIKAIERDPRAGPYGYFSGGSFVFDMTRIFMWFDTIEDLVFYISTCEPIARNLDNDQISAFKAEVNYIFNDNLELTNDKLLKVNQASKCFLCIDWWGCFNDLLSGNSKFSKHLRSCFRDGESDVPIESDEVDDFIDFMRHFGF